MIGPSLKRLEEVMNKIKVENGLALDARCMVCLKCRKVVNMDDDGNCWCGCRDERTIAKENECH